MSYWRVLLCPKKTTSVSRAPLTEATATESLCTSKPTQSVVECGMADRLVKVHDCRAVMMQPWPEQGSPTMAPEVSRPSWKS